MPSKSSGGRRKRSALTSRFVSVDEQTMTLTEFLLARIAEDEAAAEGASHHSHLMHDYERDNYGFLWVKTTRVLAECAAKRRIVDRADQLTDDSELQDIGWELLGHLSLPYADHPDYDESWRP